MIGTLCLRQCCITGSRRISTVSPKGAVEALRRVVHADELGAGSAMLEHGDGGHGVEAQALRESHDLVAKLVTVLRLEHRGIATGQHQNFSARTHARRAPGPADAPDKVYSFQGARRCGTIAGMFSTPSPSDASHMTPTTPWSIRAWPPILWQAGRESQLRFHHLSTRVTLPGDSSRAAPARPSGAASPTTAKRASPGTGCRSPATWWPWPTRCR